MTEQQDEFAQYLTPPAPAEQKQEPDYENMPASEVLSGAAKNLIPSFKNALVAIPSAIYNYEETGQALKQLGTGAVSKAKGALGYEQSPEQKAEDEALFNAMIEPYTSVAGFKKALVEDPFSILSTAAIPLTMGASGAEAGAAKLGQLASAGSKLAGIGEKAASATAKGLSAASYAADPVKATLGAAGALGDYAAGATKLGVSGAAGVPPYSLEKAYAAGAERSPQAAAIKHAFNSFAVGEGDPVTFSQRASKAVDALKNEASTEWLNSKGALTGANKTDIDFGPVYEAIEKGRDLVGREKYPSNAAAHDLLDNIYLEALYREGMPSGSPERTLEGFDTWKRLTQQQINQMPHSATVDKQAIQGIHAGIKQAIDKVAPEYQSLMDEWAAVKDNLQNIASLGTTSRTAANNELARFMKAQKTPQGQQLIEQLAEKDPLIPYMVAGSTLHNAGATGISGVVEKGSAPFHVYNIGQNLLSGDWKGLLGSTALAAMQGTVQSPRVMGQAAYGAGSLAGSPVGRATEAVTEKVPAFASLASPYALNVKRAEKEADPFARYVPSGYARGGKVGSQKAVLVKRMMDLAEKAKKEFSKHTEPLLNASDETIVKALHVANQAI